MSTFLRNCVWSLSLNSMFLCRINARLGGENFVPKSSAFDELKSGPFMVFGMHLFIFSGNDYIEFLLPL